MAKLVKASDSDSETASSNLASPAIDLFTGFKINPVFFYKKIFCFCAGQREQRTEFPERSETGTQSARLLHSFCENESTKENPFRKNNLICLMNRKQWGIIKQAFFQNLLFF